MATNVQETPREIRRNVTHGSHHATAAVLWFSGAVVHIGSHMAGRREATRVLESKGAARRVTIRIGSMLLPSLQAPQHLLGGPGGFPFVI